MIGFSFGNLASTNRVLARILIRAKAIGLLWSMVMLMSTSVSLATPSVPAGASLEVIPTQITTSTFAPTVPVHLAVHLSASSQALTNIEISTFSNDAVTVGFEGERQKLPRLAANSEYSWLLCLAYSGAISAPAKLFVRAAFDTVDTAGAPVHRILYATAEIAPRAAPGSAALAKAEIVGVPSTLSHERGGQMLLQVTNQYSSAQQVSQITIFRPRFVDFEYPSGTKTTNDEAVVIDFKKSPLPEIAAGQTTVIPFAMSASPQVVPGKYTVMGMVTLRADDGATQTVIASHEIEVVVLGESDLLKLIGLPSLLFLPGALIIITWHLLWSLGKSVEERATFPLPATSSDFWVVAIVLSLLAALAYPLMTQLVFGEQRDYLISYGFKDFAFIFSLAIGVALLTYLVCLAMVGLYRKIHAWNLRRQLPQTADTPEQILDKLARLNQDVLCRRVYPINGKDNDCVLVLEPWSGETELWLAPPAKLTLNQETNYEALGEQDRIVTGQLTDAVSVAKSINDGVRDGWWTIAWQPVGVVHGPMIGKANAWADLPPRGRLFS